MPPKGNPIDISSASVVDLKAQLAQQNEQFRRIRATAKYGPASERRSDKKPTIWARQNKGVSSRSQRDQVQHIEEVESQSLERSRAALERKAKIYDQMRKRVRHGSDDDDDDDDILIDFDRKYWEERKREEKESDPKRRKDSKEEEKEEDEDDDPWVEYEDEFGRTRTVRQSQLPRERSPSPAPTNESRSPSPQPRDTELADRASIRHYDSTREVRTRGVGFYQFALDDEERAEQMERLEALRQETEAARKNARSVAERRKAILQKNAERIHARRAEMAARRKGTTARTEDDAERVANFLKSVRESMNK
ncbi:hypothetical protein BX666DRAFT_2026237 [Dichotomocladium elegans]|nr:hypothetical protein BX666DRAFT_2026237 [Dichotomocladium elegans]